MSTIFANQARIPVEGLALAHAYIPIHVAMTTAIDWVFLGGVVGRVKQMIN
ncbi:MULTISPECIES: hypothetical protein [Moraxella]|uniref:hypothetical protein n=1 Tax=Moraxella TaxID=475 RepID=UPI0015F19C5B|nr:hypothetical protein [Moraxella lacunata]